MKNLRSNSLKITALLGIILTMASSCERELSEDVVFATLSKNPDVFIDGFSSGLQYFPFGGSKFDAFTVNNAVRYAGTASMQFDVPNVGDPSGAYAGAIFPTDSGRDLTGYDAYFLGKSFTRSHHQ
ncbi:MAG: hypothetical protein U5K54_09220 [Cytophagales bacterium]|nr:hypothetical protein [Cytophagales bacterium]